MGTAIASDIADQIVEWLRSGVESAGRRGAVLGLSGGIDSAVTAALCRRALGENVLGLIMPCESDPQDEQHAREFAQSIDLVTLTVRLEGAFHELLKVLPGGLGAARANLKPRLRMTALYHFANSLDYLVVGTGNRSELMVGYFTKYGDGGADMLPLGGLYKTQVRKLAAELGLPEWVIEKAPSAGLWEGQTDEEELGVEYEKLDLALASVKGELDDAPVAEDVVTNVAAMVRRTAHKRNPAPTFRLET